MRGNSGEVRGGQPEVEALQRRGIRDRLRQFRKDRGDWTERDLATNAKIPVNTVSRWGGGRDDIPSTANLLLLSQHTNLNPRWLLTGTGPQLLNGPDRTPGSIGDELRDYLVAELAAQGMWSAESLKRWVPSGDELLAGLVQLCSERAVWSFGLEEKFERPFTATDLPATTLAGVTYVPSASLLRLVGRGSEKRKAVKTRATDVTGGGKKGRHGRRKAG